MIRSFMLIVALLLVTACGRQTASQSPSFESAHALVAHPDRLRELRARCKADHASVGDAQCSAVAEATRRRFLGGGTPYTVPAAAASAASSASAAAMRASR